MPCAVILTALPVEYLAVRTHLVELEERINPQGTIYEQGKFIGNEYEWEVGIAEVGAGNAGVAAETAQAIAYFQPKILLFVGIAGGIKDVAIGDVVVATDVYGYESGKVGEQFLTRPKVGKSAYALVQRAKSEARKEEWLQRLSSSPIRQPLVFVAPIAAGEKVVSSRQSDIFQFLRASYNDAIAVEMEGFGFLNAAFAYPDIKAILIRGISNLIEGKNDDSVESEEVRQEKASHHASAFAFEMLSKLKISQDLRESHKETQISVFLDHQPPDTSGFKGRQEEIEQLQKCLEEKRICLVGILGAGGYGKSTLAAYCYKEASIFEDNPWITFNKPCSFKIFSLDLLKKLGQEVNENTDSSSLVHLLIENLSNHHFLLVLDNLEYLLNDERQFIDQGYKEFLLQWLEKKNYSTLLFTSREEPIILEKPHYRYHWLSLGGLSDDAGIELLRNHNITGQPLDLKTFVQVSDGHPLLLKLAASWLNPLPNDTADIEHILNQTDLNQFKQLVGIHRVNHEVNIYELLTASLERLPPGLKQLWLNLSVYKYRSIDLESAQAVAPETIVQEGNLRELAKRSLLEELNSGGQRKYRFLKLLKDFAQRQVDIPIEVKQKVIEYCRSKAIPSGWNEQELSYAAYDRQIIKPPYWKNQGDVVEYLEIFYHYCELEEYGQAFHFLWSTGCDIFLELQGYNSIRVELYTKLKEPWEAYLSKLKLYLKSLSAEQQSTFNSLQKLFAKMLDFLGTAYRCLGQYQSAINSHQEALELFRDIGYCGIENAFSYRNLGQVYLAQGRNQKAVYSLEEARQEAVNSFEKARQIFNSIDDDLGELLSLQDLIDIDRALGEHQRSIERYRRMIAISQQRGNRLLEATTLNNLGITYNSIGQYQDAVDAHQRALQIFQALGDIPEQAESWRRLGDAYEALGRHKEAIDAHQQALLLNDNRLEQAHVLCRLGWDLQSSGQSKEAIEKYDQALATFQELSNLAGKAIALNGLGAANSNLSNYSQAEGYYQEALKIYHELNNPKGKAVVLNNLGVIYEQQDQYRQAFNSYKQSIKISQELSDRDLVNDSRTLGNLGRVANKLGQNYYNLRQYQQAARFYQQALNAFEGINDNFRNQTTDQGKAQALLGLGNIYYFLGQYSNAVDLQHDTLRISRQLGDHSGEAEALLGLGNTYYSLGNYNQPNDNNALQFYHEALTIFQELGNELGVARVKLGLGKTYHSVGQCERAIDYLKLGGA
ncbi:MAG: tetratricopeptide repeat protein [Symploca sp. SIO2D2]|nr:tetratricopeptide repeat protein [Symploca sp. SIO2D2]